MLLHPRPSSEPLSLSAEVSGAQSNRHQTGGDKKDVSGLVFSKDELVRGEPDSCQADKASTCHGLHQIL